MQIYVVVPGDTVDRIAERYGITTDTLIYDNQLVYPYALAVGQALFIRDGGWEEGRKKRETISNGYAYPFISPWVLNETLPYLSELSVFSYGFTEAGEVIPPSLPDRWMVEAALARNVRPILTLTPFGADGMFNNVLISAVVRNESSRSRLIGELLRVMGERGYSGLDIDFEFILAEDREAFSQFVRVCADAMHEHGYQVSVALAPKISSNQKGLLYEGKDYRALGEAADHVLVMTYEWGYTYGPPMAVAPLDKVRQVLAYAVTEIAPSKINMGVPNYGYDWPLPFLSGTTKAVTIGNVEAVRIAVERGVPILFDETSQSPYFRYQDEKGVEHEVWFEDVRSLQGKFNLIEEFGLRGPGYWQIMQLFRANWLLLANEFAISKM